MLWLWVRIQFISWCSTVTWSYERRLFKIIPAHSIGIIFANEQLWCGPRNCLSYVNMTGSPAICGPDEVCTVDPVVDDSMCLTPPCLPVGHCRRRHLAASINDNDIDQINMSLCRSEMTSMENSCARLTLTFHRLLVPIVSGHCSHSIWCTWGHGFHLNSRLNGISLMVAT